MNATETSAMTMQMDAARLAGRPNMPNLNAADMHKLRKTAEEFEAVFISEMLRPMFENIEAAAPFGGGPGEKIYRDMQIDEYGKAIAGNGGIGLADEVMREMIRMQEGK